CPQSFGIQGMRDGFRLKIAGMTRCAGSWPLQAGVCAGGISTNEPAVPTDICHARNLPAGIQAGRSGFPLEDCWNDEERSRRLLPGSLALAPPDDECTPGVTPQFRWRTLEWWPLPRVFSAWERGG